MQKLDNVLVVGAGLYGAVIARRLAEAGSHVLLLEKRNHVAGNSYSRRDPESGVEEHVYGPHIFHTADRRVWDYVRAFADFNDYRHTVWAKRHGRIYPLPFGLAAINLLLGKTLSPDEARAWVAAEAAREHLSGEPANLEEKALASIGRTLYETFVKEYTEKQWGRHASELPAFIISRLPVRYTYSVAYYNHPYQGIPVNGYGALVEAILRHPNLEVRLSHDFFALRDHLPPHDLLVYTGPVDRFFDYRFGPLSWRSVRFEKAVLPVQDFQGTSVINECDGTVPYTRTHEFKHFAPENPAFASPKTVIYREYSITPRPGDDLYYPVRAPDDLARLAQYQAAAAECPHVLFGGRLGSYQYHDMDNTIAAALAAADHLLAP
ncbi:MAG: UDP-galactopyranose mutase [Kiritimatiellae bacterium]|nr:UDP-galactopyranose mutase [Kiritimatiellia bacterium]MBP5786203.1 UDP-galactopyranose mutase [Kiritimatiellia bacterium]